jgi:hypothetical protein
VRTRLPLLRGPTYGAPSRTACCRWSGRYRSRPNSVRLKAARRRPGLVPQADHGPDRFTEHLERVRAWQCSQRGIEANANGPVEMRPVGEVEFVAGIAAMSASGGYGPIKVAQGIVGFADLALGDRVEPVLNRRLMLSAWGLDLDVELQEPIEQRRLPVEMPFDQPGRGDPFALIF